MQEKYKINSNIKLKQFFLCIIVRWHSPSPLRMHYLEFPAAVVDWSVAAEQDALEGLTELRTENGINDLQGR